MEETLPGIKIKKRLSFSSNTDNSEHQDLSLACQFRKLSASDSCRPPPEVSGHSLVQTTGNIQGKNIPDNKMLQNSTVAIHESQGSKEEINTDMASRNQEGCSVNVVFHGTVHLESCCRFVSEILKCVLYQRQQLPMTYDQLVYAEKQWQASVQDKEAVSWRPVHSTDMDWRKHQRTLQEIDEVLKRLEELFCLSRVPCVLLLLGGSVILPKEMYEINMESLALACGDDCLSESSCLRQLFHTLFVADVLSDAKSVRLMPTTVLALAHRDCGVSWFLPKLHFKKPKRVKNQVIALSTDPGCCKEQKPEVSDWMDYVWFQAPVTIKGFTA
ncbi:MAD2L1-binding protein isoform X2 [Thalassophryne amazonica]|uniref:MAD2L1-binding protein isoform X2 n=1 Tax=Thalassophryne amazonica TaxID=390379 RepID=UPI001471E5A8|nr:MAD2L1-binding protein isoform X2 [Thalassophryne amazonica]